MGAIFGYDEIVNTRDFASNLNPSILATKLFVPRLRHEHVARPRLIECLNRGLSYRLILVSTPAGYGKSTLLSEWIGQAGGMQRASPRVRFGWLSLDAGDNDLNRFLLYLFEALGQVDNRSDEISRVPVCPPKGTNVESVLNTFLNYCVDLTSESVIILDDYHLIENQAVHEALSLLIERLPPQMHLVIATRSDPPLPLPRWRARGQLLELRQRDLRFLSQEMSTFLNQVSKLDLSLENLEILEERIEGWAAGLQMAALAMEARLVDGEAENIDAFIRSFSGRDRLIMDYLMEEVLQHLPYAWRDFLLRTCILERMCGPLCDALQADSRGGEAPGTNDGLFQGQSFLEALERANLFIVPLDDERCWYRYHPLFADLLRSLVARTAPNRVSAMHLRASRWFEKQRDIPSAVQHALAAGATEQVVRLIESNSRLLLAHGELVALREGLEAIEPRIVRNNPWLSLSYAWVLTYLGPADAVEERLQDAQLAAETMPDTNDLGIISGQIAAMHGYLAHLRGERAEIIAFETQALGKLPESEYAARSFAMEYLSAALAWSGQLSEASQISRQAAVASRKAGDFLSSVELLGDVANMQFMQGHLHEATATCGEALQIVGEYMKQSGRLLPVACYIHLLLSRIWREWNDLENARLLVEESLEGAKRWGPVEVLANCYFSLSEIKASGDDLPGALEAVRQARQIWPLSRSNWGERMDAWEAQLLLAQGDMQAMTRWENANRELLEKEPELQTFQVHYTKAAVLAAKGKAGEALETLSDMVLMLEQDGALRSLVQVLILKAIILESLGKEAAALSAIQHAVEIAAPEGYARVFLDAGQPVYELLKSAALCGDMGTESKEYLNSLLVSFVKEISDELQATKTPGGSLVEALSPRELEVLLWMAGSLSTSDIADKLYISINTLRSHIKNIYAKLDVHNRRQAVQRAQELGLL